MITVRFGKKEKVTAGAQVQLGGCQTNDSARNVNLRICSAATVGWGRGQLKLVPAMNASQNPKLSNFG